MLYIGAMLRIVFLVAVPITVAVYAALLFTAVTEQRWLRQQERVPARAHADSATVSVGDETFGGE